MSEGHYRVASWLHSGAVHEQREVTVIPVMAETERMNGEQMAMHSAYLGGTAAEDF